jgi:hypothetical protein
VGDALTHVLAQSSNSRANLVLARAQQLLVNVVLARARSLSTMVYGLVL